MKIKRIYGNDYRCFRDFDFQFPDKKVLISGENGCGKSTLATMVCDMISGRDYDLHGDPDPFPDDGRECVPTRRIVWEDNDGDEFETAKKTKAKQLKPEQIAAGIKAPIANSYEVNSVPKNERDFKTSLKEHGIDTDIALPMMHPEEFVSHKPQEMRKTLFSMTTSHTDMDVATATGDVDDVIKLLKKKLTLEEISAQTKASYKLASEQCDAIPNQIIGAESTKRDVDAKALRAEMKALEDEVRVILSGASAYDGEMTELDNAIKEQKSILHTLDSQEYEEKTSQNKEAYANVVNAQNALAKADNEVWGLKRTIDSKKSMADGLQRKVSELQGKYKAVRAQQCTVTKEDIAKKENEKFDPSLTKCSYCGQVLPKGRVNAIMAEFVKGKEESVAAMRKSIDAFNIDKKREMDSLVNAGKDTCRQRDDILDDVARLEQKYADAVSVKENAEAQLQEAKKNLATVEQSVTEKYAEKRNAVWDNINRLTDSKNLASQKREEALASAEADAHEKQSRIEQITNELDYVKLNREVDRRVKELNESLRQYGQQKVDCERIFDMLDRISRKKNEMLSDEINSHFKIVRFELFQYMKNGNYKETCIPMVKGADGEWREIGTAANTALSLLGKIDIAEGLQKYHGVNLPILIDGAERFDNVSLSSIKSDRQLIFLAVANNPLTVSAV